VGRALAASGLVRVAPGHRDADGGYVAVIPDDSGMRCRASATRTSPAPSWRTSPTRSRTTGRSEHPALLHDHSSIWVPPRGSDVTRGISRTWSGCLLPLGMWQDVEPHDPGSALLERAQGAALDAVVRAADAGRLGADPRGPEAVEHHDRR